MSRTVFYERPRRHPASPRRPDPVATLFDALRFRQGLRLKDLSDRTGLPIRRLSMLLRGLGRWRPAEIQAVAGALGGDAP